MIFAITAIIKSFTIDGNNVMTSAVNFTETHKEKCPLTHSSQRAFQNSMETLLEFRI